MKTNLILLLSFLHLTLLGQNLKCCESEKEVETYLSGNWKAQKDNLNYLYQYQFSDEKGLLQIFKIKKDDSLEKIKNGELSIKIIKTENGFEIETNLKFGGILSKIKDLDSDKLVLVDDDGIEEEFYKFLE